MNETSDEWLADACAYLRYQVMLGAREVILEPEPVAELGEAPSSGALADVRADLGECTRCPLSRTRTNIVFGEGNPCARLMFIGEGPGADEDSLGRPFAGRAGQLLTRMIGAMTLDRSEVYITNVVKCRPPDNRDPDETEVAACMPFLEAQIAAVDPEVIVTMGRIATQTLLRTSETIGRLRGRLHDRKGIALMPTYHPSFLLRTGDGKRHKAEAWEDLRKVMDRLGIRLDKPGTKP